MKTKVFALIATSVVALSALAFTGAKDAKSCCGPNCQGQSCCHGGSCNHT